MSSDLIYTPPPTLARFMLSDAFGRIVAGPIGSGKTVSCIMELLKRAIQQDKAPDGYRYTRFAVVRQTLKALKDTVLKDCETWLCARGLALWKVSESILHVTFDDIRSEWIFIPLEDAKDQQRLLSMQLTGAWLSEMVEMSLDILGPVSGRLGRYPHGARGNPAYYGWIGDTNLPIEMSDWHQFFENAPNNIQIFRQPGGMAPDAENLEWLVQTADTLKYDPWHPVRQKQGRQYYERLIDIYGSDSPWVRRYVHAEYGPDPGGQAVFKNTFKASFHGVDETLLIPGYPLIIGQDFGRNPWSIVSQVDHLGRLLVHQEIPGTNVGLEKHVQERLKPILFRDYLGYKYALIGDPSGTARGSIAEESCFGALQRLGLPSMPAPTNDIEARLRSVEVLLGRQVNGGPAIMISKKGCPWLYRAFNGGYRFATMKTGALKLTPDKTTKEGYDHGMDALQYICLVVHGGLMNYIQTRLLNTGVAAPRPTAPKISPRAWT